jgi:hypothetical protein
MIEGCMASEDKDSQASWEKILRESPSEGVSSWRKCGHSPCTRRQPLRTDVSVDFQASRDQVFKAFPAIANLAGKSDGGKVRIRVDAHSSAGFDPSWLRNAVEEPLEEADLHGEKGLP